MKCVDCGDNFGHGEANDVKGEWLCIVCEVSRAKNEVEAAPVVAAQPANAGALNVCRVRAMKAFFRAAQADGMDTKDADGMRAALAGYLGRMVQSRRDLSAGEWREATAGIECCILAW
jgi:hypothetical protein